MKDKFLAFKEWKKNPRHKALFQLLCWFIFFGTLYLLACVGIFSPKYKSSYDSSDKGKVTDNSIDNYINMSSYEYEYNISYDNNIVTIKGIVYNDKNYFAIGENKYYDNGELYLVDEENQKLLPNPIIDLPIALAEMDRTTIHLWLSEATIYETISYKDGSKIITYKYSPTDEYEIEIIANENDNLINTLEIDLLELLLTKNIEYNNFNINISYKNINNILSYEKNYDEYEIVDVVENENNEELVEEEV